MLTSLFTFCQADYPSKSVINGDTVCILLIEQVRSINQSYVQLDGCRELTDTLKSIVKKQDFAIKAQKNLLTNYETQLAASSDIIKKQDVVIYDFKKLDASNQRKVYLLKIQRNSLAVICAIAALKIFIFK